MGLISLMRVKLRIKCRYPLIEDMAKYRGTVQCEKSGQQGVLLQNRILYFLSSSLPVPSGPNSSKVRSTEATRAVSTLTLHRHEFRADQS